MIAQVYAMIFGVVVIIAVLLWLGVTLSPCLGALIGGIP